MTVLYSDSEYKRFDFKSFWFGCGFTNFEGIVDAAVQCTVLVARFYEGKEVGVATLTFTPMAEESLRQEMIEAVLPRGFGGLDTVTMIQSDPATQALVVDNMDYVLYS